jgi:gliding motility associated protien GldN
MKKLAFILSFVILGGLIPSVAKAQVLTPQPRDGHYDKIHYPYRRVVPYQYLREADVMYNRRVWRIIDLREKMNQPMYYPTAATMVNQRKNLITILQDAVITENSLKAYDPFSGDDFKVEFTTAEVANIGISRDSTQLQRPFPPYDWYDTVIVTEFRSENIKQYRLKEDWIFEKQRSVMEPRILGICPRMAVYDKNTGEFRDYQDMYWLYFPEVRKVIINEEVYNPYNFSSRITFDDLFMKRMFSSLIYKVDNTYDRRIEEYVKGLDALLEAESIKDILFKYEHDVWEQ